MDKDRWLRVRALVESALEHDHDPASREAHLIASCGGDTELLREARELLAEDDESALNPPSAAKIAGAVSLAATRDAQSACGTRAGPYQLEHVLGMGGMGVVYLARRCDVDFEQTVALKLVKRGMDTDEVVRRFHRERALLATLRHPGIAQLYDGGSTDDGRPWLAMERVEGEPIDRWCDARSASTDQRLALFTKVCAAVAFAHRNMVVHRDLKPSNILVTAEGAPKLLDFGLAKLLHGDPHAQHDLTQLGERALTPAYASPEQLRGEALTTATDVFSLGVVLYELLSGARAFDRDTSSPARPAPRRLSSRVTVSAAELRASDERRLRRTLRGDLETIVSTALAEDPAARYPTVDALSADIERFRRGLPIEARPASALYRLERFAARNRIAVTAGALVLASLVVGLIVSVNAYRSADLARERERVQRERAELGEHKAQLAATRATASLQIVQDIFEAAGNPDEATPDRTVREMLDEFDARWLDRAAPAPEVEAYVRGVVGSAYVALGLFAKGKQHLERVLELMAGVRDDPMVALRAREELARVLVAEADYAGALELADAADELLARGVDAPAEELAKLRLALHMRRAHAHSQMGDDEAALKQADLAVAAARALTPPDERAVIGALAMLGRCAARTSRQVEAEAALREALELHEASGSPDTLGIAAVRHELAGVLLQSSRLDEAQTLLESAVALRRSLAGPRVGVTGESLGQLGRVFAERRDIARATPLLEESLSIALESLPRVHPNVATALSRLAEAKRAAHDLEGALPLYREALEIRRELYGDEHLVVARARGNLGLCLRQMDRLDEAEEQLRLAIEQRRRLGGDDAGLAANLQSLGVVVGDRGRKEERIALELEAIELLRKLGPAGADSLASALSMHATVLQELGRAAQTVPMLEEVVQLREQVHGARGPRYARAVSDLGSALLYADDFPRAIAALERAIALQREVLPANDPDLALSLERMASSLRSAGRTEESLPFWAEALSSVRNSLGANHSRTRRVRERYATTLRGLGRNDEALQVASDP